MVNVIGLGYIGLPTSLMLAAHGVEVIGTDYNAALVDKLQAGIITFSEEGLSELFSQAVEQGIKFSHDYQVADTYIVSVPTPYDRVSKQIDAQYVTTAVTEVLNICPPEADIIIESTISPNTIDRFVRPLIAASEKKVNLAHAPERIIPGNMIYELIHNNRTIGADTPEVAERIKRLYSSFCQGEIVTTDIRIAEMTKVIENTYRAVNIAFANELQHICHHNGMDVNEIIRICNMHPRVNIMSPGPGVGCHCIPVDPWFIVGDYPLHTPIITASLLGNAAQPDYVLKRIYLIMKEKGMTDPSRVGLYGITYKENVDDYRESPTLQLLHAQRKHLAQPLKCYDPYLEGRNVTPSQVDNFEEFLNSVDFVVIMVKHDDIKQHWQDLEGKIVLDCQNICPLPNVYKL